jgi:hypothetical protein
MAAAAGLAGPAPVVAPIVAPAAPATITIIPELDALLRAPPAAPIAVVAPIAQAANVANNADSSIFVPLKQKGGGYDADSLITISSLINQWYHWTGDTAAPANYTNFGALSGIIQPGAGGQAALSNPAANAILAMHNGNHQNACEFLEAAAVSPNVQQAAQASLFALRDYIWAMSSNAPANQQGFAAQGAGAGVVALTPTEGMCWANMLDAGYNHLAAAPTLQAGEAYIPDATNAAAPIPSPAPAANGPALLPPSYLVRYAFGLLYRIKQILGEEGWSGAHWQIAFGGKKKSSRFTHRKKQYSQRRYKK